MSDTTLHYTTVLAQIDAKISALIENPQVDYQVGGGNGTVKITASQKMDQLIRLREMVMKRITSKPEEVIETLQTDMSVFGEDLSEYIP
jgi:hypothetical protein